MMNRRTADFMLMATGLGLWWLGSKTFSEYHEGVSLGTADTFQHRNATAIGSVLSLAGIGLAVYGTYKLNHTWGKIAGVGLGGLVAYNVVKHKAGEPLISLSPISPRARMHA
jgi:hypothetical protein